MWYLPRFCGRMAHLFFVCVQQKLARSNHYLSAKILLTLQLCFNMIWIHTYVLWLHALKMKLSMASISSPLLLYYKPGRRFLNQVGYGLLGLAYPWRSPSMAYHMRSTDNRAERSSGCLYSVLWVLIYVNPKQFIPKP